MYSVPPILIVIYPAGLTKSRSENCTPACVSVFSEVVAVGTRFADANLVAILAFVFASAAKDATLATCALSLTRSVVFATCIRSLISVLSAVFVPVRFVFKFVIARFVLPSAAKAATLATCALSLIKVLNAVFVPVRLVFISAIPAFVFASAIVAVRVAPSIDPP